LPEPLRFLCDLSLGGLARWLRAAGYEADALRAANTDPMGEARRRGAILLTTDSRRAARMGTAEGKPELLCGSRPASAASASSAWC